MSLSLAIAVNVLFCIALLGGLAYAMSQANRLTPHIPAPEASPDALSGVHLERPPGVNAVPPPRVHAPDTHRAPREKAPA